MTNTIITAPAADLAQRSTGSLMQDFVSFIDRGETTTRNYTANLRHFAAYLAYKGVTDPKREDVLGYRDWLMSEHDAIQLDSTGKGWEYRTDSTGSRFTTICKPATVRAYLQSVKQFYNWIGTQGGQNIAVGVHAPKVSTAHKKDSLTPDEVQSIENSIKDSSSSRTASITEDSKDAAGKLQRSTEQGKRLYAMYMLAVTAGLRTVEINRANVRDLQIRNGIPYLMVWGKGHTEADTKKPIAREVYDAVVEYLHSRTDNAPGNSPLFISTGNRSGGKRIAADTIGRMLKKAMQDAGFDSDRLTAHSLRHTAIQTVMDLTENIYTAQQYARHTSTAPTLMYLDNERVRQDASTAEQVLAAYRTVSNF